MTRNAKALVRVKELESRLEAAGHHYRLLVENIQEGALTLASDGTILYSNRRFAKMVGRPLHDVIGSAVQSHVAEGDAAKVAALLRESAVAGSAGEAALNTTAGGPVPVFLSFNSIETGGGRTICLIVRDLALQKRAEEFAAGERLARAILDGAAEAVLVVDCAGRIVQANDAADELAGTRVLLRAFDEVFPLSIESHADAALRNGRDLRRLACEGRTLRSIAAILPRLKKPHSHVSASAGTLRGTRSEPLGCVITLTDLTGQHEMGEELRASEEDSRVAMEAAAIGTWNHDLITDAIRWSDQCCRVFGIEPVRDVPRERFLSLVHPEDRECVRAMKDVHEEVFEIEYRIVWPDGSLHWISARGRVEFDSIGRPVRRLGTVLNIDNRKRLEGELRQAHETMNAVVAGSPVAIWVVDTAGRIALWNPAAEKLFGYSIYEVDTRPGMFHLRRPSGPELLSRVANGAVILGEEAIFERKGGTQVAANLSTSLLRNPDGSPRGFVALAVDVTEQKKLEGQIREAQKLESVGLLAGGIAHDFNNLLTGIIGNASLLTDSVFGVDRKRLEGIIEAGERAADLTRQLLAYAGKGQFYVQPLNLSSVVREVLPLIRMSLPKKAEILLNLDETLPAIHSDRSQLEQIVMNLVINAGEALNDSPGRVSIRTWTEEMSADAAQAYDVKPSCYVCLEVADTGCGMDGATRARIFEPFFSTKFAGRGLGLAAVHGIVRNVGGQIKVESHEGRGTRFTVLFPAIQTPAEADRKEIRSKSKPEKGSGVVLVVDDEVIVRSMAETTLRQFGFTVITASNGKEAVERFAERAGEIDAVLLDVKMPVMDGGEALKEIRRIRPDVKALISSGYNEPEALRSFGAAGVAGFVQKPYTAAALVEAIRSVVGNGRTSHAVTGPRSSGGALE